MGLEYLALVTAVFGSVAAAAERFTAIAKLLFKDLRDDPTKPPPKGIDGRGICVYAVAYVGGLIVAAFWGEGGKWGVDGHLVLKVSATQEHTLPVAVVALFGLAGSAFWSSTISFISAAKDIKNTALKEMRRTEAPMDRPDAIKR
ncbi:MAG: hypothetical protein JWQ98_364 [Chlorobi bacterium]|nr:hypothetical protein [Chlorobiota bacterium]